MSVLSRVRVTVNPHHKPGPAGQGRLVAVQERRPFGCGSPGRKVHGE